MASAVSGSCHQTLNGEEKSDAGWSSLVARRAHNPKVVGSNPAPATNPLFLKRCDATLAQLVERNLAKVEVTSSSLVCRSKFSRKRKAYGFGGKWKLSPNFNGEEKIGRGVEQLGSSSGS